MKRTLTSLTIIALCTALAYFTLKPEHKQAASGVQVLMPWDIEIMDDGTSKIFNLQLEHSTVAETLNTLGIDHDLAIISDQNDHSGLEIYYSHFAAGPIKGKLVITVQASQSELEQMQARAGSSSYLSTGARKFLINQEDLAKIQHWPITSLSFIPSASLDKDIIEARFGPAEHTIAVGDEEEEVHYLYPGQGLDIALNKDAKEVLQYVAPRSFNLISSPLNKPVTVKDNATENQP